MEIHKCHDTHKSPYSHAYIHTRIHSRIYTRTYSRIYSHIHIRIYSRIHTCTRIYSRVHTRIHTLIRKIAINLTDALFRCGYCEKAWCVIFIVESERNMVPCPSFRPSNPAFLSRSLPRFVRPSACPSLHATGCLNECRPNCPSE